MDNSGVLHPNNVVRGSPLKAVILSFLLDIIGTFICSVIYLTIYAVVQLFQGMSSFELAIFFKALQWNSLIVLGGYIIGAFFIMLSGYTCARIVKVDVEKSVAILGLLLAMTLFIPVDFGDSAANYSFPLWLEVIFFMLTFVLVFLVAGFTLGNVKYVIASATKKN